MVLGAECAGNRVVGFTTPESLSRQAAAYVAENLLPAFELREGRQRSHVTSSRHFGSTSGRPDAVVRICLLSPDARSIRRT